MMKKIKRNCGNCLLGTTNYPCNMDDYLASGGGCEFFLPKDWQGMIYIADEWYQPSSEPLDSKLRRLKKEINHE